MYSRLMAAPNRLHSYISMLEWMSCWTVFLWLPFMGLFASCYSIMCFPVFFTCRWVHLLWWTMGLTCHTIDRFKCMRKLYRRLMSNLLTHCINGSSFKEQVNLKYFWIYFLNLPIDKFFTSYKGYDIWCIQYVIYLYSAYSIEFACAVVSFLKQVMFQLGFLINHYNVICDMFCSCYKT